jgi:uncharacterized protein (DUF2062 family)
VRPWWRHPLKVLLRARLRRRHVHGTLMHRILGERLFAPELWIPNREATALGFSLGVLAGFLPLPGLQIVFAALLCYFFRANIAASVLATFITNPFTTVPISVAQYKLGQWLLPAVQVVDSGEYARVGRYFSTIFLPFLLGSAVSAVVLALLAYPLSLGAWSLVRSAILRRRAHLAELRRAAAERVTAKENAEE